MNRNLMTLTLFAALGMTRATLAAPPKTVAGRTLQQWSEQLHSSDVSDQLAAVVSLRQFGAEAIDPLMAATHNSDEGVRLWAVSTLGDFADDVRQRGQAEALTKQLDELLVTDRSMVCLAAAYARCRLASNEPALQILAEALSSDQRGVCVTAADYLGALGPAAAAAVPALQTAAKRHDYHEANAARRALQKVKAPADGKQ